LNNENYDDDDDDDDIIIVFVVVIIVVIVIILKKQRRCGLPENRNQWKVLMGIVMNHQMLQNFQPFAKKSVLVGYDSASAVPEISNDCTGPLDSLK
jgi:hypothetical protein